MTPEAIRRLADLQLEKQYGIHTGDGKPRPMPAPESGKVPASIPAGAPNRAAAVAGAGRGESDQEFERRTTAENRIPASGDAGASSTEIAGAEAPPKGPLEAIALYKKLLAEYPQRLTAAYEHLKELNTQVDTLNRQYEAFVRTRQAATQSYVGYDAQIARLRERVGGALQHVEILKARQGQMIENVAINQLEARRQRLVAQQIQARFGVADSYDRASRTQSDAGGR